MEDRVCPVTALQHFILKNQESTLTSQTAISEFGTPGLLESKGVQAAEQRQSKTHRT